MSDPIVSPTEEHLTHMLSLSDGQVTLGLRLCNGQGQPDFRQIREIITPQTTIRTGTGVPTHSDKEPPFLSFQQDDWSGGRGSLEYGMDASRFMDSKNAHTQSAGKVFNGPKATEASGLTNEIGPEISSGEDAVTINQYWVASPITPSGNFSLRRARFYGDALWSEVTGPGYYAEGMTDSVTFTAEVKLLADSGGVPGTELSYNSKKVTINRGDMRFDIPIIYNLSSGTTYWIAYKTNHLWYGSVKTAEPYIVKRYVSSWETYAANSILDFTLFDTAYGTNRFFEYKRALYCIRSSDDRSAPKLFLNGYRGVAVSNAGTQHLLKSGLSLTTNVLVGCVAYLTGGTGSNEDTPWRLITANTSGGDISVTPNWNVPHDTTTEFVILNCDSWQEITGHGLSGPITDVLVVGDYIYFAQGTNVFIRRAEFYNSSGTWTRRYDDETKKYDLLEYQNADSGKIWGANAATAAVSKVNPVTSWTDLASWGTEITCGSKSKRITNILTYGEYNNLYVLKEDSFGYLDDSDVFIEIPLDEMKSVSDLRNGRVAVRHSNYLYFSFLEGFERYYDMRLDDIGPNRDEGLPENRRGAIRSAVAYPGTIYISLETNSGFSSILVWNGLGWHEVYRSELSGLSIRNLFIQPIPGDVVDRMWVSQEEDVLWLPISVNPLRQSGYLYTDEAFVETYWYYGGMRDLNKYFRRIKVESENLNSGASIDVSFMVDGDTDWRLIGTLNQSPVDSLDLNECGTEISGRRIRFRFKLNTYENTPAILRATVLDLVERQPAMRTFDLTFLVDDQDVDLNGFETGWTAKQIRDQLETWWDSNETSIPLTLGAYHELFDDLSVMIEPAPIQPIEYIRDSGGNLRMIGRMKVNVL